MCPYCWPRSWSGEHVENALLIGDALVTSEVRGMLHAEYTETSINWAEIADGTQPQRVRGDQFDFKLVTASKAPYLGKRRDDSIMSFSFRLTRCLGKYTLACACPCECA